jgi:thioredoxin-dependent peroxiredoxin
MNIRTSLTLLVMLLGVAAQAATPPTVGALPPEFSLQTLDGKTGGLAELRKEGAMVLVMLRGFPGYQCPLCTRQVNEFAGRAKEFADKGARVVFVYPGPAKELQARAKEFLANKDWPAEFVLLLDPDYAFTEAYGLRWDAKNETAYPSTFVIGRDGKVAWSKISKSHGGRTTGSEVLAQL